MLLSKNDNSVLVCFLDIDYMITFLVYARLMYLLMSALC